MHKARKWSYSRLHAFECPRQYHSQYMAKEAPTWEPPMRTGSLFHEFAEDLGAWCYDGGRKAMDLDKARALASRFDDEDLRDLCLSWAEHVQFDWAHVLADGKSIERWCECELPNGDRFRGKLDRALYDPESKVFTAADYKTSWHPPAWDPEAPPFQARCYALLVFRTWPAATKCVAQWEYVRSGEIHEWDLFPPLNTAVDSIMSRIERIEKWEADVADPKSKASPDGDMVPGPHCGYCKHLLGCPLAKTAADIYSDPARLPEAWDMEAALAAKASALRGLLKAYSEKVGGEFYLPDGRLVKATYPEHADPDGFVFQVRPDQVLAFLKRVQAMCGGVVAVDKATSIAGGTIAHLLDNHPEAELDEFLVKVRGKTTLKAVKPELPAEPEPAERR